MSLSCFTLSVLMGWRLRSCVAARCSRWAVCVGLLAGATVAVRVSAAVPDAPILRITTEMHTAPIVQIDVDPAGRFLVTGSLDKSVGVWDLATGELERRLYPPIGAGEEGRIHAVAISPDGALVAASGWTGYQWDQAISIYLFDRASGRLRRRITNLPGVVNKLAFDHRGRRLAAALGGAQGIRLFDVGSGQLLAQDSAYLGDSYGLDFDSRGRLVASSLDSYLRLYDDRLRVVSRVRAPGGEEPLGVAFSPDGKWVAVGYHRTPYVDVLDGDDLLFLYEAGLAVRREALSQVAWSRDGQTLFAAGFDRYQGRYLIRHWSAAGRGPATDWGGSWDTVTGLQTLPDGGLLFSAQDPTWRRLDAMGRLVLDRPPETVDARRLLAELHTDQSGKTIRFLHGPDSRRPAIFSLAERRYLAAATQPLHPPRTSAPGLRVRHWQNSADPQVNDRFVSLEANEIARAVAVHPDGDAVLIGTDWYLRFFDPEGAELWRTAVPNAAWAVNFSGDGHFGLAALSDGTLRWYRESDGEEVLAFFPHALDRRWVLWTPGGYYDASIDGEELISWHLNRGSDQAADLFPVQAFRDALNRPAVIDGLFVAHDERRPVTVGLAEPPPADRRMSIRDLQPPIVTLLAPREGAASARSPVFVEVEVKSPSGKPVTAVHAYVDGRPVDVAWGGSGQPPKVFKPGKYRFQVPIPARDCAIGVLAETELSVGEPDVVKLRWAGPALRTRPRLFVLAVGIGDYADKSANLKFADQDAKDIAEAWRAQDGALYENVRVKILVNDQAVKHNVVEGLEWLDANVRREDVAVLFLAGHGIQDPRDLDFRFLLHDADRVAPMQTRLAGYELRGFLKRLRSKAVVFLDTCHAGSIYSGIRPGGGNRGIKPGAGNNITRFINQLQAAVNGVVVFSATTGTELAQEFDSLRNGAFTEAVIEGLNGAADSNRDGAIYVLELGAYLSQRVPALTLDAQRPVLALPQTIEDFPLAMVPGASDSGTQSP